MAFNLPNLGISLPKSHSDQQPSGTLSIGTVWMLEIFPFDHVYPEPGEFKDNSSGAPGVSGGLSSALSDASVMNSIKNGPEKGFSSQSIIVSGPGVQISLGLKSLSFTRSKESPSNAASVTMIGKVPSQMFPGVWCCLTTLDPNTNKKRVKFIGQIATASYSYQTQATGNVTTVSTFTIREWSSCLHTAVRMDSLTVSQSMFDLNSASSVTFVQEVTGFIGEDIAKKITSATYNPFLLATLILQMLGAISENNSLNQIPALAKKGYYEVASRFPTIPPALLKRLGLSGTKSIVAGAIGGFFGGNPSSPTNSLNSFANGFVKFINGIRIGETDPKLSDGTWDGVFGSNGAEGLDDYQTEYTTDNTGRPVSSSIGFLMSMNQAAWEMLTTYCDPSFNEFFTDIYYEIDEDGNERSQPVFVFRDKPYLLDIIKKQIPNPDLNKFSSFDNLPRTKIDSRAVLGFNFSNTILNSANLVRVDWSDTWNDKDYAKTASYANGYNLLLPEMLRFGGNEKTAHVNFAIFANNTDKVESATAILSEHTSSVAQWWAAARDVLVAWTAYDYRFGAGTLTLKDYNIAVSVGNNVEFQVGNFTLVGHIESMVFSAEMDTKGGVQNTLRLILSKIVQKNKDGNLVFIRPDQFGSLAYLDTEPKDGGPPNFPKLPEGNQIIGAASSLIPEV